MKGLFLLFLATIAVAQLSQDCQYVAYTYTLSNVTRVRNCFESYVIHQDVIDAIIRNLEIIHDIYVYTDIAQNPPSEPKGYFKKMNFTSGLEELKRTLAASSGIASEVFPPIMKFINGFRDGHFGLSIEDSDKMEYVNIFNSVYAVLPFKWDVIVEGDTRKILIHSPDPYYLSTEQYNLINSYSELEIYVDTINGIDAFEYFSNFFGDYRIMKSPQGSLVFNKMMTEHGFPLLRFPLDNIFDNLTLVFSDTYGTSINFTLGFYNENGYKTGRDTRKFTPVNPFSYVTLEEEKKIIEEVKHFKMRSVRQPHTVIPCDTDLRMNYMEISSFNANTFLFLQELFECVALFDTNEAPITVILPKNGGGSPFLLTAVLYTLMPSYDYRTIDAFRKSERTKQIVESYVLGYLSTNKETCDTMETEEEVVEFWNKTVVDDLGEGVTHKRTEKAIEGYKEFIRRYLDDFKMKRFVRNPTDIIVATDGFCFSSCANFIDNIIRSGSAIVAGYGPTNPGDELFGAGQCPSGVIDPADYFDEIKNNSAYGISFSATIMEAYAISEKMDEIIPVDYEILPVDDHLGYYGDYIPNDYDSNLELRMYSYYLNRKYNTFCNPKNKRLLFIHENCTSSDPHAKSSGYACGSDGIWNESSCKVATCEDGYIVDFENDKCIPNTCNPLYAPPVPHTSSSVPHTSSAHTSSVPHTSSEVKLSSSTAVHPLTVVISAALTALLQVVYM